MAEYKAFPWHYFRQLFSWFKTVITISVTAMEVVQHHWDINKPQYHPSKWWQVLTIFQRLIFALFATYPLIIHNNIIHLFEKYRKSCKHNTLFHFCHFLWPQIESDLDNVDHCINSVKSYTTGYPKITRNLPPRNIIITITIRTSVTKKLLWSFYKVWNSQI